jgi:hypothetical protein
MEVIVIAVAILAFGYCMTQSRHAKLEGVPAVRKFVPSVRNSEDTLLTPLEISGCR